MTPRCVLWGVLAFAVAVLDGPADAKQPSPKLDGKWKLVRMEYFGKVRPKEDWVQRGWVLADGKATITMPPLPNGREPSVVWDCALDASKSPAEVTLTMKRPVQTVMFRGIYKLRRDALDGDKLTLCLNDGLDPTRPTEFKATREDGWTLLVLERDP